MQAADKSEVEGALADARKALDPSSSVADMRAAHDKLTQASHKLAEVLYKANAATAGQGAPSAQADGTPESEPKKDEGVIDAEYVDVDEKK